MGQGDFISAHRGSKPSSIYVLSEARSVTHEREHRSVRRVDSVEVVGVLKVQERQRPGMRSEDLVRVSRAWECWSVEGVNCERVRGVKAAGV